MKSTHQRVFELSTALVKASPKGVRYLDLEEHAVKKIPGVNVNTVKGALNRFRNDLPDGIIRPVRGLFITQENWAKRDKKVEVPTRVDRSKSK